MRDIPPWVGFVIAGALFVGILLEGLGLVCIDWLERRLTRKQKVVGTAVLLIVGVAFAAHAFVQVYRH